MTICPPGRNGASRRARGRGSDGVQARVNRTQSPTLRGTQTGAPHVVVWNSVWDRELSY